MNTHAPRIMIAATASGVGKTTITCGLLQSLRNRGLRVQAYKCGPDYLDPMFHEQVLGVPSRNLDLFLGDTNLACELVAEGTRTADVTVIEGAMGYYDGIGCGSEASAYQVACATNTPVVLVVDARGRALSAAAEVAGFARFRTPSQVAGIILNRVSAAHAPRLASAMQEETGLPVLGYLPRMEDAHLESRHLGLVSATEVADLRERVALVARTLEQTVDVNALLSLAQAAGDLAYQPRELPQPNPAHPIIAVAHDAAFSFYYSDTLALLKRLGATLVSFSPLTSEALPSGTCGLYLGGGYPELHARQLSQNDALRAQIREAIDRGMPTIAECGGFMYLQEELVDADGTAWPMVGALPGRSQGSGRLVRFGYARITAKYDTLLARAGESLPVHEFHYWESDQTGDAFHARKAQSSRAWECVVATDTLHAGYPHLYLAGSPRAAQRFVDACAVYGAVRGGHTP